MGKSDIIPKDNKKSIIGTIAKMFQAVWTKNLMVDGFINKAGNEPIDPSGETEKGLTFDADGNAELKQNLEVDGFTTLNRKLRMKENIILENNFVNGNGANDRGMSCDSAGNVAFDQKLQVNSTVNTSIPALYSKGGIRADGSYYFQAEQGITATITLVVDIRWNGSTLEYRQGSYALKGGIITNATVEPLWKSVPS